MRSFTFAAFVSSLFVKDSAVAAQSLSSDPHDYKRMWEFATIALTGAVLLSRSRPRRGLLTTPALLSTLSAILATIYILRSTPISARLPPPAFDVLKPTALGVLGYVIYRAVKGYYGKAGSAPKNLSPAAIIVAATWLLAGYDIVPGGDIVPIIVFSPLSIALGAASFKSRPEVGPAGKFGATLVIGSALERCVFASRLMKKGGLI